VGGDGEMDKSIIRAVAAEVVEAKTSEMEKSVILMTAAVDRIDGSVTDLSGRVGKLLDGNGTPGIRVQMANFENELGNALADVKILKTDKTNHQRDIKALTYKVVGPLIVAAILSVAAIWSSQRSANDSAATIQDIQRLLATQTQKVP